MQESLNPAELLAFAAEGEPTYDIDNAPISESAYLDNEELDAIYCEEQQWLSHLLTLGLNATEAHQVVYFYRGYELQALIDQHGNAGAITAMRQQLLQLERLGAL